MDSDEILNWTKVHKKELISEILSDANLTPSKHPIAIFMAGLPGAGKTELSRNLVKELGPNFFRLDMDELAAKIQGYAPEKADMFRAAASLLMNILFSKTIKENYNFIMDGTFGSPKALENIKRCLAHHFQVQINYVHQDPKLAWQFTLAREKIEHRAIKQSGFIETYFKIKDNLNLAIKIPQVSIDVVQKNLDNSIGQHLEQISPSDLDRLFQNDYNKDRLKDYINEQNS